MGMAGIVMIDRDPVEPRLKVLLHLPHKVAREALQIRHFIGVFGRHDKAELMPVLSTPLDKGLAVSVVLKSRIGLPSLPVPIDSIAFEVAKMRIDRLGCRLGPFHPMRLVLPPLRVELDDPRLDSDAAR